MEASVLRYYKELEASLQLVALPHHLERDAFKNSIRCLANLSTEEVTWSPDFAPIQFGNSTASKAQKLCDDIDALSRLEERIYTEKSKAIADGQPSKHDRAAIRRGEQAGAENDVSHHASTSKDEQITQLQLDVDLNIGRLKQWLHKWLQEYGRLLWPESVNEPAQSS